MKRSPRWLNTRNVATKTPPDFKGRNSNEVKKLYADLLKKTLLNTIYRGYPAKPDGTPDVAKGYREMDKIMRGNSIGVDAHTMVGMGNLNFLENAISDILAREVPGDFIECGVWRGGNSIFATAMFLLWDKTAARQVFVADAFEKGFPKSTKEDKLKWEKLNTPLFMDSEEKVKQNFATYNMLRANVIFLSGFFADTLPTAPLSKLAIVRLDGDSYASYIFNLNILYPKLAVGGYLIVDDWGIAPVRKAVSEFLTSEHLDITIIKEINGSNSAYWIKM